MQLSPSSRLEDNCHFNSRTHVECDNLGWVRFIDSAISTRALTWSATSAGWIAKKHSEISTHALTWSATSRPLMAPRSRSFQLTHSRGVRQTIAGKSGVPMDFNSRTHVECDWPRAANHDTRIEISTHALTWSATKLVKINRYIS